MIKLLFISKYDYYGLAIKRAMEHFSITTEIRDHDDYESTVKNGEFTHILVAEYDKNWEAPGNKTFINLQKKIWVWGKETKLLKNGLSNDNDKNYIKAPFELNSFVAFIKNA